MPSALGLRRRRGQMVQPTVFAGRLLAQCWQPLIDDPFRGLQSCIAWPPLSVQQYERHGLPAGLAADLPRRLRRSRNHAWVPPNPGIEET